MSFASLRVAILYDGKTLTRWQREAIGMLPENVELVAVVADDEGPHVPRRPVANGLYYALNLLSMKGGMGQRVAARPGELGMAAAHQFTPVAEGNWARLPDETIAFLEKERFDAVVKFGLGLLRIPAPDRLSVPILSYHHGDPRAFRGRPGGFWETLQHVDHVGQMVQQLSNRLDAGTVLAYAETPVIRHSYRQTLEEARRLSPYLLTDALGRVQNRESLPIAATGPNYRLPSNVKVLSLLMKLGARKIARLWHGLLFEKAWRVSRIDLDGTSIVERTEELDRHLPAAPTLPLPPGHVFIADPFVRADGKGIFVEAMERGTGLGRIFALSEDKQVRIETLDHHLSYPCNFMFEGALHLLPEMKVGGAQQVFRLEDGLMRRAFMLDVEAAALNDPTLFEHDGRWWLFANLDREGSRALRLWSADSPRARFAEHPASPVRRSGRGARMGGAVIRDQGRLLRFGQDRYRDYGDGLQIFEILALDPTDYREKLLSNVRLQRAYGPHTLASDGNVLLFDWYCRQFAPLAGWRRISARLAARRASRDVVPEARS